jgi:hypothetical protein
VGSGISHGIEAELKKRQIYISKTEKGTKVTSPASVLKFLFSAEKGQWLLV